MSKTSKLRHTVGNVGKQPLVDISPSGAIWDCGNTVACNSSYLAMATADRGVTIVAPDTTGKMKTGVPIIQNPHAGAVLDLAFNPFASDVLFTAGEDGNVRGWRIPEGGLTSNMTAEHALTTLSAHSKKVGVMAWHPSAAGVLSTVGMDHVVNIWDVESKTVKVSTKQAEQQTSFNWNIDGTLFNTTSRDKNVYVFDARTGAVAGQAQSHRGAKVQRSVWAKRRDLIVTFGFDQQQHRELKVWDPRNLASALHTEEIDQQSAVMAPYIDEDTGLLFFSGKGDVEIQYYDLWRESTPIVRVGAYLSSEPIRGLCMAPKLSMRLKDCEVARFHVAHSKTMTTASFTVPRRQGLTQFQSDLYPPTFASAPALTAADYFAGKASAPLETDYSATFEGGAAVTSGAPAAASPAVAAAAPAAAAAAAPAAAADAPAAAAAAVAPADTPAPAAEVPATPEPAAPGPAATAEEPQQAAATSAEEPEEQPKKEEQVESSTNKKDEEATAAPIKEGDDEESEAKRVKLAALKVDVEAQQAIVEKLRVELAAAEAQHAATVAQIASLSQ